MKRQAPQASWLKTGYLRHIQIRSPRVALLLGTILALINHGDRMVSSAFNNMGPGNCLQTLLVPYGVASWSAVETERSGGL